MAAGFAGIAIGAASASPATVYACAAIIGVVPVLAVGYGGRRTTPSNRHRERHGE